MPLPADTAWFPAKKFGWGWGSPNRWQGWFVFAGYVLTMAGGYPLLQVSPVYFIGHVHAISAILLLICWLKGEKPRWRWGKDT